MQVRKYCISDGFEPNDFKDYKMRTGERYCCDSSEDMVCGWCRWECQKCGKMFSLTASPLTKEQIERDISVNVTFGGGGEAANQHAKRCSFDIEKFSHINRTFLFELLEIFRHSPRSNEEDKRMVAYSESPSECE